MEPSLEIMKQQLKTTIKVKKLLIITFYYPPSLEVAANRIKGLVKHLPQYGWECTVIVPKLPGPPPNFKYCKIIETPYKDIVNEWKKKFGFNPNERFSEISKIWTGAKIKRILFYKIKNLVHEIFAYPDRQRGWYPFALKYAREIMQKEKFDAIISSSPPVTSHLVAYQLKKEFDIAWIADLRDLWTQNPYNSHTRLRIYLEKKLEKKTLNAADAIVTVSKASLDKLKFLFPKHRIYCVLNGFDPDEISPDGFPLSKKFTITYTGQLYEGRRNPGLLFEVINSLIKENIIDPKDIELRFYGPIEYWLIEMIDNYHLSEIVKIYGQVPREIVLNAQRESQILLLLTWDNPEESGVIPGKIFEYLAAKRPILLIGKHSGALEIVNRTNAGVCVENAIDLRNFLITSYLYYKENGYVPYSGNIDEIMQYTHQKMASKFSEILTKIT